MKKIAVLIAVFCLLVMPYPRSGGLTSQSKAEEAVEKSTPAVPLSPAEKVLSSASKDAANPAIDAKIQDGFSKRVSFQNKEIPVRTLLEWLRKISNLNIVATRDVSGSMTFLLEDVTVADALEIVLISNRLAKEIKGNIVYIMTEAEYQALYGEPYNSRRLIKTFRLEHAKASKIVNFLNNIRSPNQGKIVPDDGTGTLIIIDVPEKMQQMEDAINRLDVPKETRVFELKYGRVRDIEPHITKALTKEGDYGEIKVDERMNRLIVNDAPRVLEEVANLVRALDAKPREVLIEAKMIAVNLSNEFSIGINWQQVFSQFSKWENVDFTGTFPMTSNIGRTNNLETKIGSIPKTHQEIVIRALEAYGTTKMISAPRLTTLQDQLAVFKVVIRESYVEPTTTQSQGGTVTTTENIKFIDVGIKLEVKASINEDKFIVMKITPEISAVTRYEPTAQGNRIPIVDTATTDTTVMVKDGVTLVIGGLIRDDKDSQRAGVPILSSLPFIGGFFGSTSQVTRKTETIVFMTPYIVTGEMDMSILSMKRDLEETGDKELKELKPIR